MNTFGPSEWVVTITGLALAALVIWYFLFSSREPAAVATEGSDSRQEVTMIVQGGYKPNTLELKQGVPARIIVDRRESGECSEELVIPGVLPRRFLAPFEKTVIEFTPEKKGEFTITCGMGMLHGKLIVK